MGFASNIIVFTFALALFASLTLPPCNVTGTTTGCNDAILLNMNTNGQTLLAKISENMGALLLGAGAVGIIAGAFLSFNFIAMFAPIAGWLLAFAIMPSNLFNAFNLGQNDPALNTLVTSFQFLFQIAFSLSILSWLKGGSDL